MAHSFVINTLQQIAANARRNSSPIDFLDSFSSLHLSWHQGAFSTRRVGFLLYHWHVIEGFKTARGPSLWRGGIRAFTRRNFSDMGSPYSVTTRVLEGDIQSLMDFSREIEGWHNEAHMAVGMSIGRENEMMDPLNNIYIREFWRLHYFINARFLEALRRYDPAGSVSVKIDRIEEQHHSIVGRV